MRGWEARGRSEPYPNIVPVPEDPSIAARTPVILHPGSNDAELYIIPELQVEKFCVALLTVD